VQAVARDKPRGDAASEDADCPSNQGRRDHRPVCPSEKVEQTQGIGSHSRSVRFYSRATWKLRNEVARLARMSRRRARHPEEYRREAPKLVERIRAKVATLECPCPSRYRPENAERDRERIAWLTSKRRSRARLTKAGERGACASQYAPCGLQDRTGGDRAPTPK
jgi:hypothetical protein